MAYQLIQSSPTQSRRRLAGIVSALAAAAAAMAMAAPAGASAEPHYKPPCNKGNDICLFENVKWNHWYDDETGDGGQQIDFRIHYVRGAEGIRKRFSLNGKSGSRYGDRSLVNRVSSYANYSDVTYCVYDGHPNGAHTFLWEMLPGSHSSWVGRKNVGGRTVNDRADYIEPADKKTNRC